MEADGLEDGVAEEEALGLLDAEAEGAIEALGLLEADGDTEAEATREISYSFTNSTNGRVISLTTFE